MKNSLVRVVMSDGTRIVIKSHDGYRHFYDEARMTAPSANYALTVAEFAKYSAEIEREVVLEDIKHRYGCSAGVCRR